MYTRAITLPIQPGKVEKAINIFETTVAPMFQQLKGFKGGYLVGDRASGRTVSFTLWDSETDASALDTSGFYDKWVGMLKEVMSEQSSREQDELYLQF
jgi:heme-degrading monooxygenase HmoA